MSQTVVIGVIAGGAALGFGLFALLICALCSYKLKKNREKYLQKHGHSAKLKMHADNKLVIPKTDLTRTQTSDTTSAAFPAITLLSPISSNSYAYCSSPTSSTSASSCSDDWGSNLNSDTSDALYVKGGLIQKVSHTQPKTHSDDFAFDDDYSYSSFTSSSSGSVALSSLHDSEMSDVELSVKYGKTKKNTNEEGLHTPKASRARREILELPTALASARRIDESSRSSSSVVLSSLHSNEYSRKCSRKSSDESSSVVLSSLHDSEISDTEVCRKMRMKTRCSPEQLLPTQLAHRCDDGHSSESSSSFVLSSLHSSEKMEKTGSKESSSVVLSSLHSSEMSAKSGKKYTTFSRSRRGSKKSISEESSSVVLSSLHSSEMSAKSGKKYTTQGKDAITSDQLLSGGVPALTSRDDVIKNDRGSFDSDTDENVDELSDDSSCDSSSSDSRCLSNLRVKILFQR